MTIMAGAGATLYVGVIGPGLVGAALLRQIASQIRDIADKERYDVRVIGIARSKEMVLLPYDAAADASSTYEAAAKVVKPQSTDLGEFLAHLQKAGAHKSCLVDCTASQVVADQYVRAMEMGVHVVTPNKKAFSSTRSQFNAIYASMRKSRVHCFHETTVGAGLPIISTLQNLLRTGDEIVSIEGIFSGTLSYIFNEFSTPTPSANPKGFAEIVKVAKESGYTEPDPRDDLNGVDVARKVTILARICGFDVSVDALPIDNVVPEPLRNVKTGAEFMSNLASFDSTFAELNASAANEKQVLRYVGVVAPGNKSCVKLQKYPFTHPFASLKGSDNIIAFTTKRYPNPLIVQGAGAGAEVTAQGAFADILTLAKIAC